MDFVLGSALSLLLRSSIGSLSSFAGGSELMKPSFYHLDVNVNVMWQLLIVRLQPKLPLDTQSHQLNRGDKRQNKDWE